MNTLITLKNGICQDGLVCELIHAAMLLMLVISVPVILVTGMP